MSVTIVVNGQYARTQSRVVSVTTDAAKRKKLARFLLRSSLIVLLVLVLAAVVYRLTSPPSATLNDLIPLPLFVAGLAVLSLPWLSGMFLSASAAKKATEDDVTFNRPAVITWLNDSTKVSVDEETADRIARVLIESRVVKNTENKPSSESSIFCGDFLVPGQGNIQLYNKKNNWFVTFQPDTQAV